MNHTEPFQPTQESFNVVFNINEVVQTSFDIWNNELTQIIGYQYLFHDQTYMVKNRFKLYPACDDLPLGCSRIHIQMRFKNQYTVVNRKQKVVSTIFAIAATIGILRVIHKVFQ